MDIAQYFTCICKLQIKQPNKVAYVTGEDLNDCIPHYKCSWGGGGLKWGRSLIKCGPHSVATHIGCVTRDRILCGLVAAVQTYTNGA